MFKCMIYEDIKKLIILSFSTHTPTQTICICANNNI